MVHMRAARCERMRKTKSGARSCFSFLVAGWELGIAVEAEMGSVVDSGRGTVGASEPGGQVGTGMGFDTDRMVDSLQRLDSHILKELCDVTTHSADKLQYVVPSLNATKY